MFTVSSNKVPFLSINIVLLLVASILFSGIPGKSLRVLYILGFNHEGVPPKF